MTRRHERAQTVDALVDEYGRTVMISVAPVMKGHADLQDAVVEGAVRRARRAPEELEGLVLFEELPAVELLDGLAECGRRGLVAACPYRLGDLTARDALRRARRLALAATRRAAFR